MDYKEEFIVGKNDVPVKNLFLNNLLENIQGHILTFI